MQPITAEDPLAASADLVAQNRRRIVELFPEALGEGGIDFEVLRRLLGDAVDEREERYGLNWHGKRAARQLALTPSTGTLRPAAGESVDWDTTGNVMIEGDNLEVLKLLQKSYAEAVKLIYIDPPYNTGKDFVYPDNFRDSIANYKEITGQSEGGAKVTSNPETSGRFHTDWLNMMYPRWMLARNLLRDDGFLMMSCDDAEVANAKLLIEELFDFPKPEALIQRLIEQGSFDSNDSEVFLDFFAGSGTTGHAVMAQNAADGGNRRCIQVQLPSRRGGGLPDDRRFDQRTPPPGRGEASRGASRVGRRHRLSRLQARFVQHPALDPAPADLHASLLDATEHLRPDRTEAGPVDRIAAQTRPAARRSH